MHFADGTEHGGRKDGLDGVLRLHAHWKEVVGMSAAQFDGWAGAGMRRCQCRRDLELRWWETPTGNLESWACV